MLLRDIVTDVRAVQDRDPAARSFLEVLLLYQGVHALIAYRIVHWFWKHEHYFITRSISQFLRFMTLIEIHPGAKLGKGILIDHGAGVVVDGTAEVGDSCTIYRGVTLGGVGTKKGRRHLAIDNNMATGAGTKTLGSFEVGDSCEIAVSAMLLKPLQADSTAIGISARPVRIGGRAVEKEAHTYSADLGGLQGKIESIQQQIDALEQEFTENKKGNRKRGA